MARPAPEPTIGAARGLELAHDGGVERVDRGRDRAVERGVELAPFAGRHDRAGGQAHRLPACAPMHHRIGREHLAQQGARSAARPAAPRRLHRARLDLGAGVGQHGAGEHVLGLGMSRHAEARHVDADDAHAVDLLRQQPQRHAADAVGTQRFDHHDRVIACAGSASSYTASRMSSNSLPVTSVSELNGT